MEELADLEKASESAHRPVEPDRPDRVRHEIASATRHPDLGPRRLEDDAEEAGTQVQFAGTASGPARWPPFRSASPKTLRSVDPGSVPSRTSSFARSVSP